jgi:hypothetical protein
MGLGRLQITGARVSEDAPAPRKARGPNLDAIDNRDAEP